MDFSGCRFGLPTLTAPMLIAQSAWVAPPAAGVPFAFCTGYGEAPAVPAALAGAPTLAKPYDEAALLALVVVGGLAVGIRHLPLAQRAGWREVRA